MKVHLDIATIATETIPIPRSTTSGSDVSSSDSNNNKRRSVLSGDLPSEQTTNCFLGSMLQGILSPLLILLASAAIICFHEHDFVNMADPLIGVITATFMCVSFYPQSKCIELTFFSRLN